MKLDVILIWVVNILSNMSYALFIPFVPVELHRKGVSQSQIGWIIATYSVGVMVTSPFVGKFQSQFGRRNIMMLGIGCQCIANIAYGFTYFIVDPLIYTLAAIGIRIV